MPRSWLIPGDDRRKVTDPESDASDQSAQGNVGRSLEGFGDLPVLKATDAELVQHEKFRI